MKRVLLAVLVCTASVFASWDYFPIIGKGKGEAKIAFYDARRGYTNSSWGPEFKIRYSPMENLEFMSRHTDPNDSNNYVVGLRYQITPAISAGLDVGLPLPTPVWSFTPNAQFSIPLTEALLLGSNAELTIPTEDSRNNYKDWVYFKIGAELDLAISQSIVWFCFDISSGLGEDSSKRKASDFNKGLKLSPAVGYIANVSNLAVGTNIRMDFGEKSGNDPQNTTIGIDAALKF